MHRRPRLFRWGAWLALAAGLVTIAAAATIGGVGALALAGKVSYPTAVSLGPFEVTSDLTMPVSLAAPVCQESRIGADGPRDCFPMFVHADGDGSADASGVTRQDADVRPVEALLRGKAPLVTSPGWSPYVAATVLQRVLGLVVLGAVVLLVWRILAAASAGEVFGRRTVRNLRLIGWITVAAALAAPAVTHLTDLVQLGYSVESFGAGPLLLPGGLGGTYPDGIELWQLGLGALALLLAEVYRHGAALHAEQSLTV